nr:MAG TPA: hypothetical protein [Caudoviricetes sp.]
MVRFWPYENTKNRVSLGVSLSICQLFESVFQESVTKSQLKESKRQALKTPLSRYIVDSLFVEVLHTLSLLVHLFDCYIAHQLLIWLLYE